MAEKNKIQPEEVELELVVTEPEDIISQLNVAISGRHGLIGGPNMFSAAAAGRNDSLPCTTAHSEGVQQIKIRVVPDSAA